MKALITFLLSIVLGITTFAQTQQKRVAVILFNWQDKVEQPFTLDHVRQQMFTNTTSVAKYYSEVSFGQLQLVGVTRPDGDVFGWYTLPFNSANCLADSEQLKSEAQAAAQADGFVAADYDAVIYAMPSPGVYCGGIGGFGSYIWYPAGQFVAQTVAHELGHCFGRSHANGWSCKDMNGVPVTWEGASCQLVTYGNFFDVMGSGYGHMSIYEKGLSSGFQNLRGWLQPGNIQDVTADGDYTIVPLEQASVQVQALRIVLEPDRYLWLDFRRPFGAFEANGYINAFPGPLIYFANGETQLLDMTPETSSFGDAALGLGKTFTYATYGLTVTTTAITDTFTTVHVAFDPSACVLKAPWLSITPNTQTGLAGQALTYQFTLMNRNITACAPSTYTVTPKVPSLWAVSPAAFTETLNSGQQVIRAFTVTSKNNARAGNYTIYQKAVDITNRKLVGRSSAVYVVN